MSSDNTDRIIRDLLFILDNWQPPTVFEQVDRLWAEFDKKWAEIDRVNRTRYEAHPYPEQEKSR